MASKILKPLKTLKFHHVKLNYCEFRLRLARHNYRRMTLVWAKVAMVQVRAVFHCVGTTCNSFTYLTRPDAIVLGRTGSLRFIPDSLC